MNKENSKDKIKGKKKENNNDKGENEIIFKIITLGDSGVGKTSIITRYTTGNFIENIASTLGVNFSYKNLIINKTVKITLKLIDTCGQEKYRSLSKAYFRNTDGVLFIFGLNDKDSFDNIKEWMECFNKECLLENVPKILVGNKCDLEIDKELNQNLIKEFAEENNIKYFETSARDNKNINELFEEMGKMIYKKGLPLDKQEESFVLSEIKQKKAGLCAKCLIEI
jgi:small GTP-binding protein